MVETLRIVDSLYGQSQLEGTANTYLAQIVQAQTVAPFSDQMGVVASTLQNGDLAHTPPYQECLVTPFQCISERVGLAATTWAIFADQKESPFPSSFQTITFAAIPTQTVGTPLALTASASSGLPVSFSSATTAVCTVSGSTVSFVAGGSCTITASQAGNSSYAPAASVSQTFQVVSSPQTITFSAIAAQTVCARLTLSASASSGLPVSFTSSTTGVCTVSGSTASFIATGSCTITASQAGNSSYAPATPVSQTFQVVACSQTITFSAIAAQPVGTPLTLSASASSGLPVSFSSSTINVCTVSGSTASFIATGNCTITASQAGNSSYAPATSVSQTFQVVSSSQTITFNAIPNQTSGTSLALTASASSGLPVSFTSSTTGVCTVSGSAAFFIAKGSCTIIASQSGNSTYAPASPVSQTFQVLSSSVFLVPQTITFNPIATQKVGTPLTLTATATSNLPVSYTSSTLNVCTVSGTTASFIATGTCTITASQAGNSTYQAATPVSQNFLVNSSTSPAALQFVPVTPCRVVDTRWANGSFGGPEMASGSARSFFIPNSTCGIPPNAAAYSLNVTVVPDASLRYLAIWPSGQTQPVVSTLNSDGRVKANAAIVPAGTNGGVAVFVSDPSHVILDINGYFVAGNSSALEFYPLTPCRIADTRSATGPLGGPFLSAGVARTLSVVNTCAIPPAAQAYSLNFTAIPHVPLGYLSTWPAGQPQPLVSTLNASTGAVTANAAIVPAGTNGAISVYASNDSDLAIDVNGYFAAPGSGGLSLYNVTPCRALDTRSNNADPIVGILNFNISATACNVPVTASAVVLNVTVVPPGDLRYLSLWATGTPQPVVSTLNASDGAVTSNMAIVPATNGSVGIFPTDPTHLILDTSGYFAP